MNSKGLKRPLDSFATEIDGETSRKQRDFMSAKSKPFSSFFATEEEALAAAKRELDSEIRKLRAVVWGRIVSKISAEFIERKFSKKKAA